MCPNSLPLVKKKKQLLCVPHDSQSLSLQYHFRGLDGAEEGSPPLWGRLCLLASRPKVMDGAGGEQTLWICPLRVSPRRVRDRETTAD